MDTARLRTIGVQTSNCTANASTQTTCFDAFHGYAENLADWVITEAFKYGRDLDKFASCIVDCILMEVFMAKSLRNLASYVEECNEADKPYPPVLTDSENAEQLIRLMKENILIETQSSLPISQNDSNVLFNPMHNGFDSDTQGIQNIFCISDYPTRSEFNSALSNPDSLQMLEDDIIRCLQTLTDDEEELMSAHPNSDCFSDNFAIYQQFSSQISELDSGFLSSEDSVSVDQRIANSKRSNLPSLTEELEESFKFKWPEPSFRSNKSENGIRLGDAAPISRTEIPVRETSDPVTERQKLLRSLLVRELKASVECRRRKIEDEETEDVDIPSQPSFKAQATNSIWMPGQPLLTRTQEQQFQSIEPSPLTRLENLDCTENQNESSAKYQKTFFEKSPCIEDLSISSRGLNGVSKTGANEDLRKAQKTDSNSVPFQNIDQTSITCIGANEKEIQNPVVVDQKVIIENNEIHTDTYYAAPVREVTTTNRVIKAPTYDGIGPTEDGIPIGLRTAVQKEYSSDWYKTMFRSLHRQDKPEEKKLLSDGYMSDPEFIRKEKSPSIVDNKNQSDVISNGSHHVAISNDVKNALNHPFPAAKSSYRPYSHKPWIISDYEPGYSSIADTEAPYENKRHLPPLISPKPKYVCNDGYESDSTLIRKTGKIREFDPQEQKQWYQEIQRGGDIPIHGLGKPAPEKMKEPIVGPPPPMPASWDAEHYYNIYSTTETDPNRNEVSTPHDQSVNNYSQEKLPKLQDDFRSKLDEVLISQHEDNLRHSPRKFPAENSQSNSKSLNASPSSSPVCPFKVTVLYDFDAQTSRELSLKKGDIVNVRRKIDKNWLEGEHRGVVGILPISYVEPVSKKSSNKTTAKLIEGSARAKFDFVAQNSVELSLQKDDVVTLVRQVDRNWYEGKLNGKTGIFPICYVEVISEPQHAVTSSQTSTPSSIKNEVENSKEEPVLHHSEVHNQEISPERDTENGNETAKKTKTIMHNHEGNKVIPYKSIYAYKPQNDDELELKESDVVYVVEKCDDGWFVGTSMRTELFGTFPGNYVEKI